MRDRFRVLTMKGVPTVTAHNAARRKTNMFPSALAITLVCILGAVWPMLGTVFVQSGNPSKQTQVQTDLQRLEGRCYSLKGEEKT